MFHSRLRNSALRVVVSTDALPKTVVMPIRSISAMAVQEEQSHCIIDARIRVINDLVHECASFRYCRQAAGRRREIGGHHSARYSFCNRAHAIAAVARRDLIFGTMSSACGPIAASAADSATP